MHWMHDSRCRQSNDVRIIRGFSWEDSAEECFLPGCWLQHYANTDTCKMQVSVEKEKGAQSWRKNSPIVRNIVRWNRRLDWKAWLIQTNLISTVLTQRIQILKSFNFSCLNMLEIRIQTIVDANWSQIKLNWLSSILAILLSVHIVLD